MRSGQSDAGAEHPAGLAGAGRKPLRDALYMPALVAIRFNPDLAEKYRQLKATGKPSKVAIIAVMRKLLILANTLVKDDREWQKNAT